MENHSIVKRAYTQEYHKKKYHVKKETSFWKVIDKCLIELV